MCNWWVKVGPSSQKKKVGPFRCKVRNGRENVGTFASLIDAEEHYVFGSYGQNIYISQWLTTTKTLWRRGRRIVRMFFTHDAFVVVVTRLPFSAAFARLIAWDWWWCLCCVPLDFKAFIFPPLGSLALGSAPWLEQLLKDCIFQGGVVWFEIRKLEPIIIR